MFAICGPDLQGGPECCQDASASAWSRRVKPLLGEDIMQLADDGLATQSVEDAETLQRIRQGLHTLRPEEKEVFLLRQNGELTYAEIAAMRNCPVGTIKTQMRTALEKLRRLID